jgi:hypothetical protein
MTDYNLRARQYHIQAAHLRWLASADENLETRDALFTIARKYERMATQYSTMAVGTSAGARRGEWRRSAIVERDQAPALEAKERLPVQGQ